MALNTFVALDRQTVTSNVSYVDITNIPQTYTDLVLEISVVSTSTNNNYVHLQFNGDTNTNYATITTTGYSSTTTSTRFVNRTNLNIDYYATPNTTIGTRRVSIQSYSNTNTYKPVLIRSDRASAGTDMMSGVWRSNSAITSIRVTLDSAQFASGTTISLYGIKALAIPTAKATGGTITFAADGYTYHAFTSTGTFTPSVPLTCDYMIVAGGGGGGGGTFMNANGGGGGGAGGLRTFTSQALTATGYSVTVGAGGAAGNTSTGVGGNGTNSSFNSSSSTGGGGGGSEAVLNNGNNGRGSNGGSGGGGSQSLASGPATGNAGGYTPVEGYNAGSSNNVSASGSGGGGAGGLGGDRGNNNNGGAGGIGATSTLINALGSATNTGQLSSNNYYYAGGGGGGTYEGSGTTTNIGGAGGGGKGNSDRSFPGSGTAATANTGGGGGGGNSGNGARDGYAGGSGIVIIRYASA